MVESPSVTQAAASAAPGGLNPTQVAAFRRAGFVLVPGVFAEAEVAQLRCALDRLVVGPMELSSGTRLRREEPRRPGTRANPHRVWMISDIVVADDLWFRLVTDTRIVAPMIDILGPDVNLYNSFARIKPPGTTAHLDWHQDWPHDRHDRPGLVTAILYLDTTGPGAAATEVVVGSHRRGELPSDDRLSLRNQRIHEPVQYVVADPGDVLFLDVMTIHRAGQNSTSNDRRAVLVEGKSAELRDLRGASWLLKELPLARNGTPFASVRTAERSNAR
ncbi:phytanoyl-CoA dioxygenase family protein [Bradyrhizobium sp. HKCCYLRH3061]|uniref:phytanoyl-CoA dioxygenase family protein n=1 Tax=Bradyrhizobium sp. HKCCYLRH3061 TaxID=3420734 RepID=UPI003EBCE0F5